MLDIKFIRENRQEVEANLRKRGVFVISEEEINELRGEKLQTTFDAHHLVELVCDRYDEKLKMLKEAEELRNKRNTVSEDIGRLKKQKEDASSLIAEMKGVSDKIKSIDEEIRYIDETISTLVLRTPNMVDDSVPVGKDETENVEVRKWGQPREFDFKALNHWDLGEMHDIIDFERASKIAGARFAIMKGFGARLERSLMNFMLDHNTELGYKEVFPPVIVNAESMTGTGQLPKFKEELFQIKDPDHFYLIPTAEVPVTNIHRDEILNEADLPLYYTAYTPCFRREAGSYGKDTRGLIRQHQFNKVELVKFVKPEDSMEELEKLTANAEDILQKLELPYRVIALCTGDMGFSAAKTYDIEV